MSEAKPEQVSNEVRIGYKSKPKEVLSQFEKLLKEDKLKEIHLSAIGTAIGELVVMSEILKSMYPDLFQKNIFSTIAPKVNEKKPEAKVERLFPKLEIIFAVENITEKEVKKMSEDERKILIETLDKQKENIKKGRRRFRNAFRRFRRRRFQYGFRRLRNVFNSNRRRNFLKKNNGYNRRPYGPFAKNPINMRRFNASRKNSGNRSPVKN